MVVTQLKHTRAVIKRDILAGLQVMTDLLNQSCFQNCSISIAFAEVILYIMGYFQVGSWGTKLNTVTGVKVTDTFLFV